MKCEQCGTENLDGATFCKKCKSSLLKSEIKELNKLTTELYCKCGQKIEKGWNFCPSCQTKITELSQNQPNNNQEMNNEDDKLKVNPIYIFMTVFGIMTWLLMKQFLGFIIAIIGIIAGRIQSPQNKFFRIAFLIVSILFIFFVLLIVYIIVACNGISIPG